MTNDEAILILRGQDFPGGPIVAEIEIPTKCRTKYASRAEILSDGLGAGLDMQLFVNAAQIGANGINADAQLVGDLFIGQPFGQAI